MHHSDDQYPISSGSISEVFHYIDAFDVGRGQQRSITDNNVSQNSSHDGGIRHMMGDGLSCLDPTFAGVKEVLWEGFIPDPSQCFCQIQGVVCQPAGPVSDCDQCGGLWDRHVCILHRL